METALAADNGQSWAGADDRFHRKLVSVTGNRRLQTIVSTCSDQVHRARLLTLQLLTLHMRPAPHKSNEDHRALVGAFAAGDAERARKIHRDHRIRAKTMMIDLIASHGFSAM